MTYLRDIYATPAPQSEPIIGRETDMVQNDEGGYVFPVDDWARLRRFLILGSEGGSYYVGERQLTLQNVASVRRCIAEDGPRAIEEIAHVSMNGFAPRNDPALFALALCLTYGDKETKRFVAQYIHDVARTGSHILQFVSYVDAMRGWGRALRTVVAKWYQDQSMERLTNNVVKYRNRHDWTHRDLLRKAHPKTADDARNAVYQWATHGLNDDIQPLLAPEVLAYEQAKQATPAEVVELIRQHDLTWEMVPTEALSHANVWEALAEKMPLTAYIRNLATLTRYGVLAPLNGAAAAAEQRLTVPEALRRARVHPIAILQALMTYKSGKGQRGQSSWTPVPQVLDALDIAFDRAFVNAPQTGKRFYLGIDVSGSMNAGTVAGVAGLTPRIGAAAMAMAIARREPQYYMAAFSDAMVEIPFTVRDSLAHVVETTRNIRMGGTDCALPMLDAMEKQIPVDCFVVITDSETWYGNVHPAVALQKYRQKMGIPAKLVVIGMVSNRFTIADPQDGGMLDVAGFDASVPQVLADFVVGA